MFPCECPAHAEAVPAQQQQLTVRIDRQARKGKTVTLIEGFVGPAAALNALAKTLKKHCGCGGSAKAGVITIQGEKAQQVVAELSQQGFGVRRR